MKHVFFIFLSLWMCSGITYAQIDEKEFASPGMPYRPVPLWFWNNTALDETELVVQFWQMIVKDGYGGCAILPFGKDFKPEYLTEKYFQYYGRILQEAEKLKVQMSLYDEYGFPSGSMGAINADGIPRFMNKYPGQTVKRLDKFEYETLPGHFFMERIPEGKLMAAVAMDTITKKRVPLLVNGIDRKVEWKVPKRGAWKVFLFVCVKDGDPNVDYLDPAAVKLFVEETHQAYYDRFAPAFGPTLTQTFFDEPTMYRAQGRMWTEQFNEKFEEKHGYSPELLYPALWYDIGQETGAARNALFGMRAALYAEGFMKVIQEWSAAHRILSTGHQDQEEILNPVSVSGDLMLCGKYMDIPGIDKIGGGRPTELFYKVVSSSADNWDKAFVMSETYGAMGNLPVEQLYHIAMEQYTKGINMLIPHAVWYNDRNVTFLPELSYRNPIYRDSLPSFNRFLSRLNYMLQRKGRHVADIAVLYPIETLQAGHYLDGPLGYYEGGVALEQVDYATISSLLTDSLGFDFTYLHPEVLAGRCRAENGNLYLDNPTNKETFRLLIVPGMQTISLASLKKIETFYKSGGYVLFTTVLPSRSVEFRKDKEVRKIVKKMLSVSLEKGGRAFFLPQPTSSALKEFLKVDGRPYDVEFTGGTPLNYIHKVFGNQSVYYFANLKPADCQTEVQLEGKAHLMMMDPHTGRTSDVEYTHQERNGIQTTVFSLPLKKNSSVFILREEEAQPAF